MSEAQSEIVMRTVSEAEEYEFHKQQEMLSQEKSRETTNQQNNMQIQTTNSPTMDHSKAKSISPRGPGTGSPGSRSGSHLFPSLHNATLPSKLAIIVGLCQVAVGGAMVLTGMLAIRYQSYMFHYGTGLWAGLLSAITGMLGAMCTKKGFPKPSWLCGGSKWQIHVFLIAICVSLCSVVLLAIFSTSGLLQDAKTVMVVEYDREIEEIIESKNTSGIFINTILLLLSILQVLLCFSSLGLAVRVMFKSRSSLLSSKGSTGSEIVAVRDMLAPEYTARKDHLIHWLGNQKPSNANLLPLGCSPTTRSTRSRVSSRQIQGTRHSFVAIPPVLYPRRVYPPPPLLIPAPPPAFLLPPPQSYPYPSFPICAVHGTTPTPSIILSSQKQGKGAGLSTPVSSVASLSVVPTVGEARRHRRKANAANRSHGIFGSVKSFQTHSSKAPSVVSAKTESEKNNELEVTEVDVSRTYTGLDRSVADEYLCAMNNRSMSNSRKASSSVSVIEEIDNDCCDADEDYSSERESTRM